jgi:hypothetical protein
MLVRNGSLRGCRKSNLVKQSEDPEPTRPLTVKRVGTHLGYCWLQEQDSKPGLMVARVQLVIAGRWCVRWMMAEQR